MLGSSQRTKYRRQRQGKTWSLRKQGLGKQHPVPGQLSLCAASTELGLVPALPPTCCVILSKSWPSLSLNIFLCYKRG